jgi:hypothetical protein
MTALLAVLSLPHADLLALAVGLAGIAVMRWAWVRRGRV